MLDSIISELKREKEKLQVGMDDLMTVKEIGGIDDEADHEIVDLQAKLNVLDQLLEFNSVSIGIILNTEVNDEDIIAFQAKSEIIEWVLNMQKFNNYDT